MIICWGPRRCWGPCGGSGRQWRRGQRWSAASQSRGRGADNDELGYDMSLRCDVNMISPPPRWLVLETSSQALTRQHRRLTIWILGNMGWQDPYDITDTEARCLVYIALTWWPTEAELALTVRQSKQFVTLGGKMRRFLLPSMKHIMPYDLAAWLWKWMKFFKLSFFIFSLSSLQILWHKVSYRRTGRTSISISKNAL